MNEPIERNGNNEVYAHGEFREGVQERDRLINLFY